MSGTPTTWISRPVCATEAMIEVGVAEMSLQYPFMSERTAFHVVTAVINAALKASPKPPAVSAWQDIASAPKDGTRILFGGRWRPYEILPGGEWTTIIVSWSTVLSNGKGHQWLTQQFSAPDHWNVDWTHWQPLPEPPATGDAEHG